MKMQDRIFTTKNDNGEDLVLRFKRPNQLVLSKAELTYRTAFSRAFRQDIITNAEVEKLLRDRGLWDEEQQEKSEELRQKILELEEKLKDPALSNEDGDTICASIDILRLEVMSDNLVYQSIADNTCEAIAKESQNEFLCSECIVDNKTSTKVYKDVDDFKARMDESIAADAFRETVIAVLEARIGQSLPSNLSDEYAENKWRNERLQKQTELVAAALSEAKKEKTEEKDEKKTKKRKKKQVKKTS